jgi:hypothetical protein
LLYIVAFFVILRRVTYEIPPAAAIGDYSDNDDDGVGRSNDVSRESLLSTSHPASVNRDDVGTGKEGSSVDVDGATVNFDGQSLHCIGHHKTRRS